MAVRRSERVRNQLDNLRNINDNESGDDEISDNEQNENDLDYVCESSSDEFHSSLETEDESGDDTEMIEFLQDHCEKIENQFKSKNGKLWSLQSRAGRATSSNIIRHQPGPTTSAKVLVNSKYWSSVNLFLSDTIISKICLYTNLWSSSEGLDLNLTPELFKKYLGLILARSVYSAPKVPVNSLWSDKYGMKIFKETMPRDMFKLINRCLRFDDKSSRQER